MGYETKPPPYEYGESYFYRPRTKLRRRMIGVFLLITTVVAVSHVYQLCTTPSLPSRTLEWDFIDALRKCDSFQSRNRPTRNPSRENPRWNPVTGQTNAKLLRNVTLFDGESFLEDPVDISFQLGIITSVVPTSDSNALPTHDMEVWDLDGKYVTPGLVDMHSHHLAIPWPQMPATEDGNEMPKIGPLTPFVRSIDSMKPYDPATAIIASGGVTSSLILPGSANIMGGEAYMVKNIPNSGENTEPIVEDLLLDHGLVEDDRQRYIKMACGENPKRIYGHTRMGNAWLLREHFAKARDFMKKQKTWCEAARKVPPTSFSHMSGIARFINEHGDLPKSLELDSTIAMLRGEMNVNVHCYEPEDLERMLAILHEFGIHPRAFHHALWAWQIPGLLREQEPFQAAVSHSFGLPGSKALQSVTSVPAKSVQQDHRIGYVRSGYDADLVVWNSHPLTIGATPLQVFIDGRSTLDSEKASVALLSSKANPSLNPPRMRPVIADSARESLCRNLKVPGRKLLFINIVGFLMNRYHSSTDPSNLTVLIENGSITCVNTHDICLAEAEDAFIVNLEHGYVTPGLTAVSEMLGLIEIPSEKSSGDGSVNPKVEGKNLLNYAKYGIHLDGKAFKRARIGGVTKGVTSPLSGGGLIQGVSVSFRTAENSTILDGGIVKSDVALHVTIGQSSKAGSTSTISAAIAELRDLMSGSDSNHEAYALAANGTLPVVINAVNHYDISQIILLKQEYPNARLIIYGAHEAPYVAKNLAKANISVILTGNRGVPDTWEKKDALPGPPLTQSPARILAKAGVKFGIAVLGDYALHNLAAEAGWAAKYADMNEKEAINLVSHNINEMLGLDTDKSFVVWDGNPLKGEGSVVASFDVGRGVGYCWPDVD